MHVHIHLCGVYCIVYYGDEPMGFHFLLKSTEQATQHSLSDMMREDVQFAIQSL